MNRCFHCGEPVPKGFSLTVLVRGEARPMCCHGCAAITEAIVESGGEAYYDQRSEPGLPPEAIELLSPWTELFKDSGDQRENTSADSATFAVEGLRCGACSWLIERSLAKTAGVRLAQANASTARLHLRWDPSLTSAQAIAQQLLSLGYVLLPIGSLELEETRKTRERSAMRRLFVAGLLSMQTMMLAMPHYVAPESLETDIYLLLQWTACLLAIPALIYSGRPFFESAWMGLRGRQLNMDLPISLGLLLAFLGSLASLILTGGPTYFESVPMFLLFVLGARQIEQRLRRDAMAQREKLALEPPAFARRLAPEAGVVAPWRLQADDILEIRSGEKLAADSVLLSAAGSLDLSALTGELRPAEQSAGDPLPEGAINLGGPIQVRVTGSGREGTLARLSRLAEEAAAQRPDWSTWADQIAGRFTVGILVLASLNSAWALWAAEPIEVWLPRLVAILVVSCPCALSVAGPAAYAAALSRLLSEGVALAHPRGLESAWRLSDIVFDKTGTLTSPSHSQVVVKWAGPPDEAGRAKALQAITALTEGASHPLARSLSRWVSQQVMAQSPDSPIGAETTHLQFPDVRADAGLGLSGHDVDGAEWRLGAPSWVRTGGRAGSQAAAPTGTPGTPGQETGRPSVGLSRDGLPLAWFWLEDELRADAQEVISTLQQEGIQVWIFSGDANERVQRVAHSLGISAEQAIGGLSPADKKQRLAQLQSHAAGRVAMVGDGLNDAPVLALADLSLAMRGSAPLAQQQADAYLMREGLDGIAALLTTAKQTERILHQNLNWSLAYNLLAIPAAFGGLISPVLAAAGMALSSLVVMLNARQLLPNPPARAANAPTTLEDN